MTDQKMEDFEKTPAESPRAPQRIPEDDPYPRMIIVCIAITVVLFFVVMGVILYDLVESDTFLPTTPGEQSNTPGFPPIPDPARPPAAE